MQLFFLRTQQMPLASSSASSLAPSSSASMPNHQARPIPVPGKTQIASKNALIGVAPLLDHRIMEPAILLQAAGAFIAFSFATSPEGPLSGDPWPGGVNDGRANPGRPESQDASL